MLALRFAAGTGEGNVTSLSYAYLLAATFVTATAFSLALISAAPLTRRGGGPKAAGRPRRPRGVDQPRDRRRGIGRRRRRRRHVHHVGARPDYAGHMGEELGRLVVYLAPWMVASAAFSIVYPLLFVMHRRAAAAAARSGAILADIPISLVARAWGGLAAWPSRSGSPRS